MSVRQRLLRPQSDRSSKRNDAPPLHCTIRSRCPFDCMREERALGGRRENYRKKSLLLSAWRSSRDLSYAPLLSSFDCNLSVSHDLGVFVLQAACECGVIQEKNLRFCPDFTRSFSFRRVEEDMAAARRGALHILRRPSGLISLTRGSGMAATVRAVATSSPLPSSSSSSPPASSSDSGILLFRGFSASNRTPSWYSSRFFAAEAAQSTGVVAVNSSLQYDTLLKEAKDDKKLAVTYFTAKWCGPCRHISPEVDRLSGQYTDVRFLKVDLDEPELQKMVDAAGISAVPTFLFHRGGKVVSKFSGADSKKLQSTVEDLRAEGEL